MLSDRQTVVGSLAAKKVSVVGGHCNAKGECGGWTKVKTATVATCFPSRVAKMFFCRAMSIKLAVNVAGIRA